MLLEGGLEWKDMSISPKDMDLLNSKFSAARDIALAFGVPPQLLGIPGDSTYNNMHEARLTLYENTIIPLIESTISAIDTRIVKQYYKNFTLSYDKNSIDALRSKRSNVWKLMENVDFMSVNEKRAICGLPPVENGNQIEALK